MLRMERQSAEMEINSCPLSSKHIGHVRSKWTSISHREQYGGADFLHQCRPCLLYVLTRQSLSHCLIFQKLKREHPARYDFKRQEDALMFCQLSVARSCSNDERHISFLDCFIIEAYRTQVGGVNAPREYGSSGGRA